MRTNIEINDKLMKEAMKASRLETKTKKAVVEEALHLLVRLHAQEGIRRLRGKVIFEDGYEEELRLPDKDKWAESEKRSKERKQAAQTAKGRSRVRKAA